MRRNAPVRMVVDTVTRGVRRGGAAGRGFRTEPVVPDAAFQDPDEPYPGHWRRFPRPWPPRSEPAVRAALAALPATWRAVVLRHDAAGEGDATVAAALGLTVEQERDLLARARAALRDRLDPPGDGAR